MSAKNWWTFPKFYECDYMNAEHIHPLKQKDVGEIVTQLKEDSEIRGIIVFGSSVEFRCHSGSDIDLYIVKDEMQLKLDYSKIQSELDILWSCAVGDRIMKEIKEKGVPVYHV